MPDRETDITKEASSDRTGLAVVISAPSGAGKTSVLFEFLKKHPDVRFSVSATTRPPREGEKEGVNYYFKTHDEFTVLRNQGELLEWNEVHGNLYGTLRQPVVESVGQGRTIILDTDTVGAFNIKQSFPDAVLIFIVPPSPEVLTERLINRRTETPERIEQRLSAYPKEIASMAKYDYIIVNDDLSSAVSQFEAIIEAEHQKSSHIIKTLTAWRDFQHGSI